MISVITCPRPGGEDYCSGLLSELTGRPVVVFHDHVGFLMRPPNNRFVGQSALEVAAAAGTDLLFLEDDVRPVDRSAVAAMVDHIVPAWAAWTSFYGPRSLGRHHAGAFSCSQALKLPVRTIAEVVRRAGEWSWQSATGIDLALASVGTAIGWEFEQAETLVRHVGVRSAARVC